MRSRWTRRIVAGALIGTVLPVGVAVATAAPAAAAGAGAKSWFGGEDATDAYGNTRLAWKGGQAYEPDRSGGRAFDLAEGGHLVATDPAAANFGTGNFALGFAARFSGGGDEQVLSKSGSCGTGLEIATDGGGLAVSLRDADGSGASVRHPGAVRDGAWHEVTVVRAGAVLTVVVDGARRSGTTPGTVDLDTSTPLRLGDGPCDTPAADMLLDDVAFGPGVVPVGPPGGAGRGSGVVSGVVSELLGGGSGDAAPRGSADGAGSAGGGSVGSPGGAGSSPAGAGSPAEAGSGAAGSPAAAGRGAAGSPAGTAGAGGGSGGDAARTGGRADGGAPGTLSGPAGAGADGALNGTAGAGGHADGSAPGAPGGPAGARGGADSGAPGAPADAGPSAGAPGSAHGAGDPPAGVPGSADGAPGAAAPGGALDALPIVPEVLHALGSLGGTTPLPAVPVRPPGTQAPAALPGTPPAPAGPSAQAVGAAAPEVTSDAPSDEAAAPAVPASTPDTAADAPDLTEPDVVPLSGAWTGRAAVEATSVVPAPDEVRTDVASVLRSALIALTLLTLLVLPARLVNRTADANADRIARRWARRGHLPGPATTLVTTGVTVAAYALGAPLLRLDASSIALALGLAAAFLLVTALVAVARQILLGHPEGRRGHLRRVPAFLLLGLLTVVATRVVGLHAGVVLGALVAVATVAGSADYLALRAYGGVRDGRARAVAATVLATVGALAWMLRDPLLGPAGEGFAGQILAAGLTAVTVSAVVHLAFAMAPVRLLDGAAVLDWSRSRWVLLAGLGAFTLVHVLLQPATGPAVDRGAFLTGVVVVYLAAVAVFVGYFRLRRRTEQPVG